ncbi:hypothetical protein IV102_27530 [bacterium]|nr:hypothetical protein [bacterium]
MKRLALACGLLGLIGCADFDPGRFSANRLKKVRADVEVVKGEIKQCETAAKAIRREKHNKAVLEQEVRLLRAEVARLEKSKKH